MAREHRRLAAILAADVVGYSRLMGRDESGTLARLQEHRTQRLEPVFARHGGRLVKLTGDGALVEFSSAVDALSAAIEFQQAMAKANRDQPEDTAIVFRIGLHLGDLIVDGDDLYGDGVNVAARLEAEAPAGGIVISGNVYDAVAGRLKASFDDLGGLALKNIERPVQAFGVKWDASDWPATAAMIPRDQPLALPDKPSIAVLAFTNMSGDPEQEYFTDGISEDIITELSRFRGLFVIARNSSFSYKGKAVDIRQVGKELGVRYVLEGSIRKAGNRVRVNAQLVDAATGNHLWAERYDRTLEDIFAVQEDVTRSIVTAVAPEMELAEMAQARRDSPNGDSVRLVWRARGLFNDALGKGQAALMVEAIDTAQQAVAADPASLSACEVVARAYNLCHLYRWGPAPEKALEMAWSAVERMQSIDALDQRTLTICGQVRVARGERERGIADLRRALDVNPNASMTLMALAWSEATVGLSEEARVHALLSLRLNPRDHFIGLAHLALAMASFATHEYAEAVRWSSLAIQSQPAAPIRRAIMIACCAQAGELQRAAQERAVLDGFAPDFIASLFRGENGVFSRPEDMEHLLDGLRLAGLAA